jgi:HAMP domain-containing protein
VQYLAVLGAMVLLSGALGWLVAGRVLRPMSEITATARRVSKESLHERIALEGPDDELKQLADTFDSMLARLEAGFERERTFVRNASHELCTPLSVIQTEADVTLADEADNPEALRRAVTVMREACRRSERLIDALLALARAERGDHPMADVDLGELVRELIDDSDLDGLRLELALRPARLLVDRQLLCRPTPPPRQHRCDPRERGRPGGRGTASMGYPARRRDDDRPAPTGTESPPGPRTPPAVLGPATLPCHGSRVGPPNARACARAPAHAAITVTGRRSHRRVPFGSLRYHWVPGQRVATSPWPDRLHGRISARPPRASAW